MKKDAKIGNGNTPDKKSKPVTPTPDVSALEPQAMNTVLRSLVHFHASALMLEHLAEYAATAFRGTDARGPLKVLQMPNGTKCRAELDPLSRRGG